MNNGWPSGSFLEQQYSGGSGRCISVRQASLTNQHTEGQPASKENNKTLWLDLNFVVGSTSRVLCRSDCSRTHPLTDNLCFGVQMQCSHCFVCDSPLVLCCRFKPPPITANLMVFQGKAVRYDHAAILNNKDLHLPFLLMENIIGLEPSVYCT